MSKTKNELATIKNVNDLPTLLPEIDKKELFNMVQESEPLANLQGKDFKIIGIMPELVEVPKNGMEDEDSENPFVDENTEMVERLRVTLITDVGVFHSYSVTFNKALAKAINVFGAEYTENTYNISSRLRGSGKSAKAYYVVKAI